jgi:hypothetical protein
MWTEAHGHNTALALTRVESGNDCGDGPVAQQAKENPGMRARQVISFTLAFGLLTAIAAAAQATDAPESQPARSTGGRRG